MSVERPIVLGARREGCALAPRGGARQSAGRPDAALHAAAPSAARGRGTAAGDDVGQPVRRAAGLSE